MLLGHVLILVRLIEQRLDERPVPAKWSTDAYCAAKYGKKWVRTPTIIDSFDPKWNEQYTWKVYDHCTVLTIGVFDNWRMFAEAGDEKPKIPAGMDVKISQAKAVDPDELDEEFDTMPSSRPPEIILVRYDRVRILAAQFKQFYRRFCNTRATKLFVGVCFTITVVLYVVPPKMVAVALGFYFLRHPMFRDPMPPASLNFFKRLPSLSDRLL
ncbi:QUIRKY [Olea europaea subsp. europaea]|uniref:QUIRKY n=1 Tax=Olea europaea subsp. europaea TaxID=158383 RepID=A0A8S0TEM8_OLEEU|nr:QUIRKY [Olea europaea subsp. europaea]